MTAAQNPLCRLTRTTAAAVLAGGVLLFAATAQADIEAGEDTTASESFSAALSDVELLIPFAQVSVDSPAAYPYGLRTQRSLQRPGGETTLSNPANDVSQSPLISVYGSSRGSAVDLSASYVWDSSRFGQFVLSTRATYSAAQRQSDLAREVATVAGTAEGGAALTPGTELQSSFTFTWQIGNHQASATTHYVTDSLEEFGQLSMDQLDELAGYIAALDLSYGYNLRGNRGGNTLFSVGLRSTVDRRPLVQLQGPNSRGPESTGRAAYGTIRYQF